MTIPDILLYVKKNFRLDKSSKVWYYVYTMINDKDYLVVRSYLDSRLTATKAATKAAIEPEIGEISGKHFTKVEVPNPQHGTPVEIENPLDNATITNLKGGNNLSSEAMDTLREHVGGEVGKEIPVGSTPENILHKAMAPVQRTIADTVLEMNRVIAGAPAFKSNALSDGAIVDELDGIRNNLALDLGVVNAQLEAAYPALESTNPAEVLAARQKLGSRIDWNNIVRNPETDGEVANLTRAKIYNALGNKIHAEIPQTVALDKIFQPNLELRSFLTKNGVDLDPVAANAEHLSELSKGISKLKAAEHNIRVDRNRKMALLALALGALVFALTIHSVELIFLLLLLFVAGLATSGESRTGE